MLLATRTKSEPFDRIEVHCELPSGWAVYRFTGNRCPEDYLQDTLHSAIVCAEDIMGADELGWAIETESRLQD